MKVYVWFVLLILVNLKCYFFPFFREFCTTAHRIKSICPKHIGILKCEQQINTINQSNRSVVWMCDTFQLTLTEFHVALTHLFSSDLLQLRINHWFIRLKTNFRLATFVLIIGSLFDFFFLFHLYNIEIWFMFWIAHDFEMLIRFESSVSVKQFKICTCSVPV